MFNIGGDDKEKLEENMEEIKRLVNEGKEEEPEETQNSGPEESIPEPEPVEAESLGSEEELEKNLEQNLGDDVEKESPEVPGNAPEETETEEERETDEKDRQGEEPGDDWQEHKTIHQTSQEEEQDAEEKEEELEDMKREIGDRIGAMQRNPVREEDRSNKPEPPSETMFLEVNRFEDIKTMIEEMHYLTTEMEDVMNHLSAGVEEDQDTIGEAREIVDEFRARRDRIEATLREE